MADKPSYKLARDERKGDSSMEIEGAIDLTKPKTSFTDKNLDKPDRPGDAAEKYSSETAKSGGSITPSPNAKITDFDAARKKTDPINKT